ncbi:hypothetical protein F5Y04DRAFT_289176 [Hypomontagnella monticulosa]|nr:hypothetical protein F5Y04DRAFT_289176 [Hypomontagnella monticulosa]
MVIKLQRWGRRCPLAGAVTATRQAVDSIDLGEVFVETGAKDEDEDEDKENQEGSNESKHFGGHGELQGRVYLRAATIGSAIERKSEGRERRVLKLGIQREWIEQTGRRFEGLATFGSDCAIAIAIAIAIAVVTATVAVTAAAVATAIAVAFAIKKY